MHMSRARGGGEGALKRCVKHRNEGYDRRRTWHQLQASESLGECIHAPCHFGTCWLEKHLPMLTINVLRFGGMQFCLVLATLQVFPHSFIIF